MNEKKKVDPFVVGLKPFIKLKVVKLCPIAFDDASRTALNTENALAGMGIYSFQSYFAANVTSVRTSEPMETENVESTSNTVKSFFNSKKK